MMRRAGTALVLAIAFVCAPLTSVHGQQQTTPATLAIPDDATRTRFVGTFVPAPGAQNQQAIDGGIERSVSALFFMIRGIARSRIRAGNPVFANVTIALQGRAIDVNSPPVHARSDEGAMGSMIGLDHERNHVVQRFEAGVLVQTCWNDSGRRVTRFTLAPDGNQLTLAVEITAPQLRVPVRYSMRYARR